MGFFQYEHRSRFKKEALRYNQELSSCSIKEGTLLSASDVEKTIQCVTSEQPQVVDLVPLLGVVIVFASIHLPSCL